MRRLAIINGVPVAVTITTSNSRDLAVRRLRRVDPTDDRPTQAHAWAAGFGSAWGDTIEEACDNLAAQCRHSLDPAHLPGFTSPAERVIVMDRRHRLADRAPRPAILRPAAAVVAAALG